MSVPFFCKNCLKRLEHNRPGVCADCHSKVSAQMPAREYMRPVQEREVLGQISQYQGQMQQGFGLAVSQVRSWQRRSQEQATAAAALQQAQAIQNAQELEVWVPPNPTEPEPERVTYAPGRTRFQARALAEAAKNRRDAAVALLELATKARGGAAGDLDEVRTRLMAMTEAQKT